MQLRCTLFFDETPPHYLTSIELRPYSPPKGDDANWYKRDWETLEALLTNAVDGSGVPAIAAIVMKDGQVVDEAAVGVRSTATDEPVTTDDRFHLGSITKSMTATLIARLIEQDKLRWDSTLGELFAGTEIREEYRNATVEQLLQHRAGFPQGLSDDDEIYNLTDYASGNPTESRARFVAHALQSDPIGRIGDDFNYSNIGYAVAGHIAERVTGQSWEQLIRTELFTPFKMTSGDFGWPYTTSTLHQPRGHSTSGDKFVPAPDDYKLGPDIAPAGDVQCTVRDLARYAWIHTQGFNGIDGPLSASTFKRLHTPLMESSSKSGYACGWLISETEGIGPVHMHNGSGGTYYAHMEIHPEQNFVIVVATNVGLEGQDIAQRIVEAVTSRYAH